MRYTAEQHTREGWEALKTRLRQGEVIEVSATIAEYLGGRKDRPVRRELTDDLEARVRYDGRANAWLIEKA